MQPSVNVITLGMADLDASQAFYSDGLGWTPALEVEGEVVFYRVGTGLLLSLFGLADLGDDGSLSITPAA